MRINEAISKFLSSIMEKLVRNRFDKTYSMGILSIRFFVSQKVADFSRKPSKCCGMLNLPFVSVLCKESNPCRINQLQNRREKYFQLDLQTNNAKFKHSLTASLYSVFRTWRLVPLMYSAVLEFRRVSVWNVHLLSPLSLIFSNVLQC